MPLAEVRSRFREVVAANKALLVSLAVLFVIAELLSVGIDVRFVIMLPAALPYLWCCSALGRLARCFGQESWTTAVSAFFFYPYELLLAYLAYGRGVRAALAAEADDGTHSGSVE